MCVESGVDRVYYWMFKVLWIWWGIGFFFRWKRFRMFIKSWSCGYGSRRGWCAVVYGVKKMGFGGFDWFV